MNNSVFLQYSQHTTNKREKRNQLPIVRCFSKPNASLMSIMWIGKTKKKSFELPLKERKSLFTEDKLQLIATFLQPSTQLLFSPPGSAYWSALLFLRTMCCHRHWSNSQIPFISHIPVTKGVLIEFKLNPKKCIHT